MRANFARMSSQVPPKETLPQLIRRALLRAAGGGARRARGRHVDADLEHRAVAACRERGMRDPGAPDSRRATGSPSLPETASIGSFVILRARLPGAWSCRSSRRRRSITPNTSCATPKPSCSSSIRDAALERLSRAKIALPRTVVFGAAGDEGLAAFEARRRRDPRGASRASRAVRVAGSR